MNHDGDLKHYHADAFQLVDPVVMDALIGLGCFLLLAFVAFPDMLAAWAYGLAPAVACK